MEGYVLPEDLRSFVWKHISSAQHAELVSFLCQDDDRQWSASEIAAQMGLGTGETEQMLDELVARGLLDIRIGDRLLYRFAPVDPSLESLARSFADLYPRRRAAVLAEIARGATAAVHDFADAFRIRRRRRG